MQFDNSKQEKIEGRLLAIEHLIDELKTQIEKKGRRHQSSITTKLSTLEYHVKRLHEEFPPFNVG